jgi:hypothetical protein
MGPADPPVAAAGARTPAAAASRASPLWLVSQGPQLYAGAAG